MPMFIQTSNVDLSNRESHTYNINIANILAYIFNQNIMAEPSSFVYEASTKRVDLHSQFDLHPKNSKIIAQQINWFLDFEEQFDNKDLFLALYLEKFKTVTLKEFDKTLVVPIFSNLNFEEYVGKVSALFLKDKINEFLAD